MVVIELYIKPDLVLKKPKPIPVFQTKSKLMNNNRIRGLNWKNEINLENGLSEVYSEFKKRH